MGQDQIVNSTTTTMTNPRKLWVHPDPMSTQMWKFKTSLEKRVGRTFRDFHDLYSFSCTSRSTFWSHLFFRTFPLVYSYSVTPSSVVVVDEAARMDSIPVWFRGVQMNFAENILFQGDAGKSGKPVLSPGKEDDKIACTEVREARSEPVRDISWKELRQRVGRLSQAMRAKGVVKGDRVAVVGSHSLDTLVVFLAVTSIGGLFSSTSTDMGVRGVLDRLLQIRPRFLFMDDLAVYNGKKVDMRQKMTEIAKGMQNMAEFQGTVSQPRFLGRPADISEVPGCVTWDEFVAAAPSDELVFERVAFSDPFLIVYSSGTTGPPKCIVHSVGGVVLNGHKEGRLHREIDEHSVQLQYTTTSWIMYVGTVQSLLMGARMVMYDGSPFLPEVSSLLQLCAEQKVTHLGISPRYLAELQKNKVVPKNVVVTTTTTTTTTTTNGGSGDGLNHLKAVTSTGMVLSEKLFEWFYDSDHGFPPQVQLDNISGGTDVAGCFATGNPLLPIYAHGGCQGASLGVPVAVFDQTIEGGQPGIKGRPVPDGEPGELVATAAFPNMPVAFWGDDVDTDDNNPKPRGHNSKPPKGRRYHNSYFSRFDDVWVHGDFIVIHPLTKTITLLGRADGVLNPSGVRFGSAEIYSVVDAHFGDRVADSICVGRRRAEDMDESVMLFLLMRPGVNFMRELVREVKERVRRELSARHVPRFVFETREIPTTVNGKKVELPIKQIVCNPGKRIVPSGTLLNPQSLEFYYRFANVELEEDEEEGQQGETKVKVKAKL